MTPGATSITELTTTFADLPWSVSKAMLTAAELDVENTRPTDFPEPRRVYAWIRYPSNAIRIQAHAIAYTKTAVKIRFPEPLIKIQREGWVWLSSVTPAPDNTNNTADTHDT